MQLKLVNTPSENTPSWKSHKLDMKTWTWQSSVKSFKNKLDLKSTTWFYLFNNSIIFHFTMFRAKDFSQSSDGSLI